MNKNSIKEAARLAGVSVASVSRALNGKPGISEKTRQRIIDICNELGYQPSDAARRLKFGKNNHVGISLGRSDKAHSHYISSLFEHVHALLSEEGLIVNIYPYDSFDSMVRDTSGVILTGVEEDDSRLSGLRKASLPFVSIGQVKDEFWVCPDDYQGGQLAASHLLNQGCKEFLIVESALRGKGTKSRTMGFQKSIQEQGFIASQLYVDDTLAVELQTYRTLMKVLKKNASKFDAIFCENDDIAYGAMLACKDSEVAVPDDLKIVGFDDLPGIFDSITTVHQDIHQIAKNAVELLYKARNGDDPESRLLSVNLVVRESTRA